jgi:ferredoxin
VRVIIDPQKCQGHLRCFAIAPELFSADEYGFGVAPDGDLDGPDVQKAQAAVQTCPEGAIRIEE